MKRTLIHAAMLAALLPTMATVAYAADQNQDRTRDQNRVQTQDQIKDNQIYGSQLMTPQERNEYRNKMRAAKTVEEREQIRNQHHEQMKVRAKERGVSIPDEPPARGMGMGPGRGAGGMGPGAGGMGPRDGGMGPGMGGAGPRRAN